MATRTTTVTASPSQAQGYSSSRRYRALWTSPCLRRRSQTGPAPSTANSPHIDSSHGASFPIESIIMREKSFVALIKDAEGVTGEYIFKATTRRRVKRDVREWCKRTDWGATIVAIRPDVMSRNERERSPTATCRRHHLRRVRNHDRRDDDRRIDPRRRALAGVRSHFRLRAKSLQNHRATPTEDPPPTAARSRPASAGAGIRRTRPCRRSGRWSRPSSSQRRRPAAAPVGGRSERM